MGWVGGENCGWSIGCVGASTGEKLTIWWVFSSMGLRIFCPFSLLRPLSGSLDPLLSVNPYPASTSAWSFSPTLICLELSFPKLPWCFPNIAGCVFLLPKSHQMCIRISSLNTSPRPNRTCIISLFLNCQEFPFQWVYLVSQPPPGGSSYIRWRNSRSS